MAHSLWPLAGVSASHENLISEPCFAVLHGTNKCDNI